MNLVGRDDWSLRIGRIDAKVPLNAGPVDSLITTLRMMGENGAASRLEYQTNILRSPARAWATTTASFGAGRIHSSARPAAFGRHHRLVW